MNRIEFMETLSRLLLDIPEEDPDRCIEVL